MIRLLTELKKFYRVSSITPGLSVGQIFKHMKLEVRKGLEFFNMKKRWDNATNGKDLDEGTLTFIQLGLIVEPDLKEGSAKSKINRLIHNKSKHVPLEIINRLVEIFGVDYNFIFGYPSKYDEVYEMYKSSHASIARSE